MVDLQSVWRLTKGPVAVAQRPGRLLFRERRGIAVRCSLFREREVEFRRMLSRAPRGGRVQARPQGDSRAGVPILSSEAYESRAQRAPCARQIWGHRSAWTRSISV